MGYYWANFKEYNKNLYRFDTRIYLDNVNEVLENDECIGAIVGKNPGSALPKDRILNIPCEIELSNDKLLPTVRNIIKNGNSQLSGRKYIQVLNLFYLCNPKLDGAIRDYEQSINPKACSTEKKIFPWIWFMWGGYNKKLTEEKLRFKEIQSSRKFYLDNRTKTIIEGFPDDKICAKHTQGMRHDLVLPFLKEILK
jgi:hypothetical protein